MNLIKADLFRHSKLENYRRIILFSAETTKRIRNFHEAYETIVKAILNNKIDEIRDSHDRWLKTRDELKVDVSALAAAGMLSELELLNQMVEIAYESLSSRDHFLSRYSAYQEHVQAMGPMLDHGIVKTALSSIEINKINLGPISIDPKTWINLFSNYRLNK